jgi:hypothetical protein
MSQAETSERRNGDTLILGYSGQEGSNVMGLLKALLSNGLVNTLAATNMPL